ncbi:vesicle transport through interaction with t-SNAREs homolog 1A isoform X1 [Pteropus medius]|uniref:vesicle transport through interaction with t-SNAREs homolog 1A isoform X1 n=1 Tax=Pteropus vampyrus TaxID=132908 RepID=UPI00196B43BD|nr:vesicle transport through interaction with t-SNAREs homolog 1A isoform X1 [Pteropus giganteus]
MSSDFEGYEQDFAVLTAEITSKIARVPRLPPDEKKQMVANVEKQLEEAKELLEQMDLEVREIPPQSRGMYSNRMRSYKQEMGKLEKDFKRSRIAYSDEVRNELLGDDGNSSENQLIKLREERAHLLDNTERLERSSRRLEAGYQIAVETEQIGQEMLENLSHDREKIQRARERLRETDANLGKSSRVLTGMLRRPHKNHLRLFQFTDEEHETQGNSAIYPAQIRTKAARLGSLHTHQLCYTRKGPTHPLPVSLLRTHAASLNSSHNRGSALRNSLNVIL